MRVLIDTEGKINKTYFLPWTIHATSFNFRSPTKVIYPGSEIREPEKVETLVINCDLRNYGFISSMVELTQLYIYSGNNISDLRFLKNLVKLRQLCILDSHIGSLQSLIELIDLKYKCYKGSPADKALSGRIKYGLEGVCIRSDAYHGDGSELLKADICFSEILLNKNRITFTEIMKKTRYRKIIFEDE